ncbi:MAG: hypothetical protein J7L15_07270 [Clostridiales bacterium]|nr:hypothetical protein [Clostridiales bacterium]
MGNRGRFKYICGDCGEENWITSSDRNSRFRSRCVGCGGVHLDPIKKSKAKEAVPKAYDAFDYFTEKQNRKMNKK